MRILAFDIGTSSTRAGVFSGEAGEPSPASFQQRKYPLQRPEPGAAELFPEDLLRAFEDVSARCTGEDCERVVTVSSMWHGLIGVDRETAQPLTPAYIWEDARARLVLERLRERMPPEDLYERTGCPLDRTFWPAKLLWLRERDPELFGPKTLWMAPAEWLFYRRTRELSTSASMASATGLYDRHAADWAEDLLDLVGISRANLLPIRDEPVEIPGIGRFVGMIGDGAAGNLGSGAAVGGTLALNFGTSAAVRLCGEISDPPLGSGLFHYRLDRARSVFGGAINNAGNLHAWLLRTLRLAPEEIEESLETPEFARPVADLHAAPFLGGERTPFWSAQPSGVLQGLRFHHQPIHIYLAFLDAVFFRLAAVKDLIRDRLEPAQKPRDLVLSGGLTNSPASVQRLATIFGQPVRTLQETEISLQGAVWAGLEHLDAPLPAARVLQEFLPDDHLRPQFLEARRRHETCVISAQNGFS